MKECILPPSKEMSSWELFDVVEPAAKVFGIGFFTYGGSNFRDVLFFLVQAWRWNAHSDQSIKFTTVIVFGDIDNLLLYRVRYKRDKS